MAGGISQAWWWCHYTGQVRQSWWEQDQGNTLQVQWYLSYILSCPVVILIVCSKIANTLQFCDILYVVYGSGHFKCSCNNHNNYCRRSLWNWSTLWRVKLSRKGHWIMRPMRHWRLRSVWTRQQRLSAQLIERDRMWSVSGSTPSTRWEREIRIWTIVLMWVASVHSLVCSHSPLLC